MFCNNLSEKRDDIKERMQENKEIEMTDEDITKFELLLSAQNVVKNLIRLTRLKKKQRNTKNSRPLPLYR